MLAMIYFTFFLHDIGWYISIGGKLAKSRVNNDWRNLEITTVLASEGVNQQCTGKFKIVCDKLEPQALMRYILFFFETKLAND